MKFFVTYWENLSYCWNDKGTAIYTKFQQERFFYFIRRIFLNVFLNCSIIVWATDPRFLCNCSGVPNALQNAIFSEWANRLPAPQNQVSEVILCNQKWAEYYLFLQLQHKLTLYNVKHQQNVLRTHFLLGKWWGISKNKTFWNARPLSPPDSWWVGKKNQKRNSAGTLFRVP
jgi:hypothetical protein